MSYSSEVLADSPRAYYRLEEASGAPQDSSGNAMHCTLQTALTYSQAGVPGIGGNAIKWTTASSSSASAPDNNLLDLGDVFTLEAWIKRSANQGVAQGIVSKGAGAYYMRLDASNQLDLLRDATADMVHSTTTITDTSSFHHVVATKNGATMHLYIDSVDVTGTPSNSTATDTTDVLYLGSTSGGEDSDCTIDEIAVYATELSAARVLAHYNAGLGIVTAGTQIIQVRSGLRLA